MPKTTAKDFQLFKTECRKWIDFFGLKGWEVHYRHENTDVLSRAMILFNPIKDRVVVIILALDWKNDKIDSYAIRRSAFHEVMELFLYPIMSLVNARSLMEDEAETEKHNLIRTLENVLFDNFEED